MDRYAYIYVQGAHQKHAVCVQRVHKVYLSDSGDGGLVHEVHELGTRVACRGPGDLRVVQIPGDLLAAAVHLHDLHAPLTYK
eukprot:scaffold180101_cov47-Prasinocladus_malaysianus.AAC.1